METLKAKLVGVAPLLMHNGQLANPRNRWAKELSKVAKGKSKDLEEAQRVEFLGGLYVDEKNEPCLTGDMVYSTLVEGAKARKLGKITKAAVFESAPTYPLQYDGPRDPDALYADGRFCDYRGVRVSMSRVMRSRPIFRKWSAIVEWFYDESLIERDELVLALDRAGKTCGLGDYRPRFGRFTVEVLT